MTTVGPVTLEVALRRARSAAFGPAEFVGQESFVTAGEVRDLALRAGIGPGVSVLDLCCGSAGPGLFLTRELGCRYLGIDQSAAAIDRAGAQAAGEGLKCRFLVGRVPPLPRGPFDVVLMLETLLAFPDKRALLRQVHESLAEGGRFVFTVEAGGPLSRRERAQMPESDTVWVMPLPDLICELRGVGLRVSWLTETSATRRSIIDALIAAYTTARSEVPGSAGRETVERLLRAHRVWSRWVRTGRIRTFALVAEQRR